MGKNWGILPGRCFAIAIGINKYENMPQLDYAVRDAEAMRDYLELEAGFEKPYYFSDSSPPITDGSKSFSSQPTYTTLKRFLRSRFERPFLSAEDSFWFFFSGHGMRQGDRDYLMPSDADPHPNGVEETAIAVQWVCDRLLRSGAGNVALFLDACRYQGAKAGAGFGAEKQKGVVALFSCHPGELSWEIKELQQGSFTYAMLEWLRGNKGKRKTAEEFYRDLGDRVPELNGRYDKPLQFPYAIADPVEKLQMLLLANSEEKQHPEIGAEIGAEIGDYYIERSPSESLCYQSLLQPQTLIRIKAPKQLGKSSLMSWVLKQGEKEGYRTACWNMLQPQEAVVKDLDRLLRSFCSFLTRRLLGHQEKNPVREYWDENLGSNDNCTFYFEDRLLSAIDTPLVLGLDNLDRIFPYREVAADFLGLLRSWYEEANHNELWQKLRLVIAHSTEDYPKLKYNNSPFNVGLAIELPEFNAEQVLELAARHGLVWSQSEAEQLMAMVGGHPYLVREALARMKADTIPLQDLLAAAPTNAGLYHQYLRELQETLEQDKELAAAMKKIIQAGSPTRIGDRIAFKLDSLGLVRKQGDEVEPRCNLYRLYFGNHL
ncbi:MAG: hypothetical protein F6J93_24780 [Oscillatoria sp. SIO1A7]|nr:hypothetical protein [Oscillatoria sp. SIO1A7]